MTRPVLSIHNLNVKFPSLERNVHAIRGCSFDVGPGEIVGLVGESGSGKSVTSMAALGLLPNSAELSGSIKIAGQEMIGRSEAELRELRGNKATMIFQNPLTALNPFFKVGKQAVDAVCRLSVTSRREGKIRVLKAFDDVALPDPKVAFNKYPHQMSGGQLQRIMIAMAIACKPDLLIADEPTTALDVTVQAQIILLLRELARKNNLSILFITHDLGVIASMCDRVAVMYAGQIVETGTVEQVLGIPGHPYTEKLMQTVPVVGAIQSTLTYIPGQVPDLSLPQPGCAFASRCEKVSDQCWQLAAAKREIRADQFVSCHNISGDITFDEIVAGGSQ